MYCKNCRNEIGENEKYCGKCGAKVDNNLSNVNINDRVDETKSNNKKTIKIKFTYVVIGISVLFLIPTCIVFIKNSKSVINSPKETQVTVPINTINTKDSVSTKSSKLDVVDSTNKEFKINAMELVTALTKSVEQKAKEDNEPLLVKFNYKKFNNADKNMNSYIIGSTFQLQGKGVYPAFDIGEDITTGNVIYIGISYPYEGYSGRNYQYSAIEHNYRLLKIALTNINQIELWNTIKTIRNSENNTTKNEEYYNNGLNGVYYGILDGYTRNDGTISGEYCVYKVEPNN